MSCRFRLEKKGKTAILLRTGYSLLKPLQLMSYFAAGIYSSDCLYWQQYKYCWRNLLTFQFMKTLYNTLLASLLSLLCTEVFETNNKMLSHSQNVIIIWPPRLGLSLCSDPQCNYRKVEMSPDTLKLAKKKQWVGYCIQQDFL